MSKHSLVKTSLGVGLMAASLGASAAEIHSFAEPMLYYKASGTSVNYVAFVPSLLTPAVLYLDLFQSGTISTWAYGVNAAGAGAAAGGAAWTATGTVSYADIIGNTATTASSTWYGGDTASVSMTFAQTPTISSQACGVSFAVSLGSNDYMQYTNFTIQPADWPTFSGASSVTYRTKSGTTAGDTASLGSAAWNALNASATSAFPTFSAYSIGTAMSDAATYAASRITKFNLCTTAYTAKAALNSAGNMIGGQAGLMRLW